jgi:hypothetical protein
MFRVRRPQRAATRELDVDWGVIFMRSCGLLG